MQTTRNVWPANGEHKQRSHQRMGKESTSRYNYTSYLMAKTYRSHPSDDDSSEDQAQATYQREWALECFTFGWQRTSEVKCCTIKQKSKQFDSSFFLFVFVRSIFCSPETNKEEITTIKCTHVRKMRKNDGTKRNEIQKKETISNETVLTESLCLSHNNIQNC